MSVAKMSQQGRRNVVAVVWIAVGLLLIWRGMPYTGFRHDPGVYGLIGAERWLALAIGVVVGIGKGFTMLRKGGRRAAAQIQSKGELAGIWTVFSPFMILLVGLMIAAGIALRTFDYDASVKAWVVGILYPGIGVALIIGGLLARHATPLPSKAAA